MLPKSERLKEVRIFNTVFKKKQRFSSYLVTVYYLLRRKDINRFRNEKVNYPKTAFIVSTKIDKRATKRNLIKRRMKAAYILFRNNISSENIKHINVLIWIANTPIKNAIFDEIKVSMNALISKLDKLIRS